MILFKHATLQHQTKNIYLDLEEFIHENTSTKHALLIDASNIKPLVIMTLKRQTGSMDGFASCEGIKGPHHFIHLLTFQSSHNPHTSLQPNRLRALFIHENNFHQSARMRTIVKVSFLKKCASDFLPD